MSIVDSKPPALPPLVTTSNFVLFHTALIRDWIAIRIHDWIAIRIQDWIAIRISNWIAIRISNWIALRIGNWIAIQSGHHFPSHWGAETFCPRLSNHLRTPSPLSEVARGFLRMFNFAVRHVCQRWEPCLVHLCEGMRGKETSV